MKLFYTFMWLIFSSLCVYASEGVNLKEDMIPTDNTLGLTGEGFSPLDQLIAFVKNSLFDLLWILWVGIFLYFWYRLITARGNADELKKVMMAFLYVVIGLAIIPLALVVVRIVSSLNF